MEADMVKRIINMPRASVVEDGSLIEMEFADEDDEKLTLSFAPDDFQRFVSRAVQLVTDARIRKFAKGDPLAIHSVVAVEAMAQAPVGGGRVILSVRSDTGLPYHFSISPEDAENLSPELFRAAKSAKKEASKSRH